MAKSWPSMHTNRIFFFFFCFFFFFSFFCFFLFLFFLFFFFFFFFFFCFFFFCFFFFFIYLFMARGEGVVVFVCLFACLFVCLFKKEKVFFFFFFSSSSSSSSSSFSLFLYFIIYGKGRGCSVYLFVCLFVLRKKRFISHQKQQQLRISRNNAHTPTFIFRHLPPNSAARTGFATEVALFTCAHQHVHRRCQHPPKGLGTNKTVKAT